MAYREEGQGPASNGGIRAQMLESMRQRELALEKQVKRLERKAQQLDAKLEEERNAKDELEEENKKVMRDLRETERELRTQTDEKLLVANQLKKTEEEVRNMRGKVQELERRKLASASYLPTGSGADASLDTASRVALEKRIEKLTAKVAAHALEKVNLEKERFDLETQIEALKDQLSEKAGVEAKADQLLELKERELTNLKMKIDRLERRIQEDGSRAEKEIAELKRKIEDEKEEAKVMMENVKEKMEDKLAVMVSQLEKETEKAASVERQRAALEKEVERLRGGLLDAGSKVSEAQRKLEAMRRREEYTLAGRNESRQQWEEQKVALMQMQKQLEKESSRLARQLDGEAIKRQDLERNRQRLEQEKESLEGRLQNELKGREEIEKQKRKLEKEMEDLKKELTKKANHATLTTEMKQMKSRFDESNKDSSAALRNLRREMGNKLADLEEELTKKENAEKNLKREKERLETQLNETLADLDNRKRIIDDMEVRMMRMEKEAADAQSRLTEIPQTRAKLEAATRKLAKSEKSLKLLEVEKGEIEARLFKVESLLKAEKERFEREMQSRAAERDERETLDKQVRNLRAELEATTKERNEKQAALDKLQTDLQQLQLLNQQRNELQKKHSKMGMTAEKLREDLARIGAEREDFEKRNRELMKDIKEMASKMEEMGAMRVRWERDKIRLENHVKELTAKVEDDARNRAAAEVAERKLKQDYNEVTRELREEKDQVKEMRKRIILLAGENDSKMKRLTESNAELEQNVAGLETKLREAKKLLSQEQLAKSEAMVEGQRLFAKVKELEQKLKEESKARHEAETGKRKSDGERKKYSKLYTSVEQQVEGLQTSNRQLERELKEVKDKYKLLVEAKQELESSVTQMSTGNDAALALLEEKKALEVQKRRLEADMSRMQAEFETKLEKKLKESKDKSDKLLALAEREIDDLENEVKDLKNQLKEAKGARVAQQGLPASLSLKEENLVKEINQLKGFLNDAEKKAGKAKAIKMKMEMDMKMDQERIEELMASKRELEGKIKQLHKDLEQAKKVALAATSEKSGGGGGGPDALRLLAQVQELRDRLEEEEEEKDELSRIQRDKLLSLEDEREDLENDLEEMKKKWLDEVEARNQLEVEYDRQEEEKMQLMKQVKELSTELEIIRAEGLPSMPTLSVKAPTAAASAAEEIDIDSLLPSKSKSARVSRSTSDRTMARKSTANKKTLILVKGKDRIHVRVVALTADSLNKSDVFILDCGEKIYQWNGVHAHRNKRTKGVEVANRINTIQKAGKSKVVIIEDESDTPPKEFWDALGGQIELPASGADDAKMENEWNLTNKLWRVNPGNELFAIEGKFDRSRLESKFVYILDCHSEVYVWFGKQTTPKMQTDSMKKAMELFGQNKTRPPWATLKKVKEGKEPVLFQEKFYEWDKVKRVGGTIRKQSSKKMLGGMEAPASPMRGASPRVSAVHEVELESSVEDIMNEYNRTYSYDDLVAGNYRDDIDKAKKESYLSNEEFFKVLGMTKEAFYAQPAWKITQDKKKHNLF